MAATPQQAELGIPAPDFTLPATDGRTYGFADIAGKNGTVIVFICNHCPYVKAVADRMAEDARTLAQEEIGFAAICANDPVAYPQDSFENMQAFAERHGFDFPYLQDETQEVARAYDAVCTPDFFGVSADGLIQYRGRLDEGRTDPPPEGARRELVEAMRHIAETGQAPSGQIPSVGCSIKWRAAS